MASKTWKGKDLTKLPLWAQGLINQLAQDVAYHKRLVKDAGVEKSRLYVESYKDEPYLYIDDNHTVTFDLDPSTNARSTVGVYFQREWRSEDIVGVRVMGSQPVIVVPEASNTFCVKLRES